MTETGFDTERGNYLMIDHGDGLTTLYAACSKVDVNEGDPVKAGTPRRRRGQHRKVHRSARFILRSGRTVFPRIPRSISTRTFERPCGWDK
ncbi:MAG: M23 family metallopeptidase [Dysosmobacter sp.]